MKIFKHFTLFRLYLAMCAAGLSGFTYAEYYGYEMMGSDEGPRQLSSGHPGSGSGSGVHHK